MTTSRFEGAILGFGSSGGPRVVIGAWAATPFGVIADAMVEDPAGHRVLIAPSADVAEFIAATYTFDEIRIEPTTASVGGTHVSFTSTSLQAEASIGGRTGVGRLLRLVPARLATARWWCRLLDPIARRLRPGVRTHGSAGNGRREYYCARDEHAVREVDVVWQGRPSGAVAPLEPPVRFGFGSAPRTPALVRVTTLVDLEG